ncbi:hypothetical protein WP50_25010 [Lactiplantibacillus plantarum]|nr:hypothetical protein WP50_25010 [Lactiplantibacillus plantarum]
MFQVWRKQPKETLSTRPDDEQIIQDSGRPWSVEYRWPRVFQVWRKQPKETLSTRPDDEQIIQDSGRPWSVAAKRTKPKPVPTALTQASRSSWWR